MFQFPIWVYIRISPSLCTFHKTSFSIADSFICMYRSNCDNRKQCVMHQNKNTHIKLEPNLRTKKITFFKNVLGSFEVLQIFLRIRKWKCKKKEDFWQPFSKPYQNFITLQLYCVYVCVCGKVRMGLCGSSVATKTNRKELVTQTWNPPLSVSSK